MPNDNSTMGESKDTQKDIEAILGECVGVDCERKKYEPTDFLAHRADYNDGYNQALADIRNRIPETARKVLERVKEIVENQTFRMDVKEYLPKVEAWDKTNYDVPFDYGYSQAKKEIIASLAVEDEGDNGKDND